MRDPGPAIPVGSLTPDTRHPTPILRDIRPSDFETLFALDQLCFEPGIAYSRVELQLFLNLATAEGVVAEVNGTVAGFSVGHRSARSIGRVVTLDVHPRHRRRGLGRALLAELVARLSRAGAGQARLEVDSENAGAIAFYESLGFRRRHQIANYYGPGRTALEMVRELKG